MSPKDRVKRQGTVVAQFFFPLAGTLLIHGAVFIIFYFGWFVSTNASHQAISKPIQAIIISANDLKAKAPKQKEKMKKEQPKKKNIQAEKPKEKKIAEKKKVTNKPKEKKKVAKKAEKKPDKRAKKKQQKKLDNKNKQLTENKKEDVMLAQAIAEEQAWLQAENDRVLTQSYSNELRQLIEQNWFRPPSAHEGMSAVLVIQLVPTGEVASVTLAQTSGSEVFDRSAINAVYKAERFEVPKETRIFEQYFRRIMLVFKPEGLTL